MTQPFPAGDAFVRYQRAQNSPLSLAAAQETVRQAAERRFKAEAELDALYEQLDAVTGWNLRAWVLRLTGRIRNRQAAATDAIVRQHAVTVRAIAEHNAAIVQMRQTQASVDDLAGSREAAVAEMTGRGSEEAQQQLAEAKRLHAAMAAAGRAQSLAIDMRSDLTSAGRWSVHDTYLGGRIASSAMKQQHIFRANDKASALTDELTVLRQELQQINAPTSYFGVQANDFVQSTDVYWDNIASDVAMARRLGESRDRLERLELGLIKVSHQLGQQYKEAVDRIDALLAEEMAEREA